MTVTTTTVTTPQMGGGMCPIPRGTSSLHQRHPTPIVPIVDKLLVCHCVVSLPRNTNGIKNAQEALEEIMIVEFESA